MAVCCRTSIFVYRRAANGVEIFINGVGVTVAIVKDKSTERGFESVRQTVNFCFLFARDGVGERKCPFFGRTREQKILRIGKAMRKVKTACFAASGVEHKHTELGRIIKHRNIAGRLPIVDNIVRGRYKHPVQVAVKDDSSGVKRSGVNAVIGIKNHTVKIGKNLYFTRSCKQKRVCIRGREANGVGADYTGGFDVVFQPVAADVERAEGLHVGVKSVSRRAFYSNYAVFVAEHAVVFNGKQHIFAVRGHTVFAVSVADAKQPATEIFGFGGR